MVVLKPANQRVCCVREQTYSHLRSMKYPNYSEAHCCKCHLPYTQLLFCFTALGRCKPYISYWNLNEQKTEAIQDHWLSAGTHNLSKHTHWLEHNYCMYCYWRAGQTHVYTGRHTVTHTEKPSLSARMGPNVVIKSIVIQCSPQWCLFAQQ